MGKILTRVVSALKSTAFFSAEKYGITLRKVTRFQH
jgi:hypothetical protein